MSQQKGTTPSRLQRLWQSTLCLSVLLLSFIGAPHAFAESANESWNWNLPRWLPPPMVPEDNPMNAAKVELGRHLFYDARLSADNTVACSTCHQQALAFTDSTVLSPGVHGSVTPRNALGLANVAYSPVLTWANPHMRSLELQLLTPLFSDSPEEMGNSGKEAELVHKISNDDVYVTLFKEAFKERNGEISIFTVSRAIAAFQRTLISVNSPYDQYIYQGKDDALSASALRGEDLFFSERVECYHCHQGFNFTDSLRTSKGRFDEVAFHNTGLYNLNGTGDYPRSDQGLYDFTADPKDRGRFRTQSLRNVALTAPYFHDGSAATLKEVIAHYASGGRHITTGEDAGDGAKNPLKNSLVMGFKLNKQEEKDLIAFLESLTDTTFLTNPAYSDPWPSGHPATKNRQNNAAEFLGLNNQNAGQQWLPLWVALAMLVLLATAFRLRSSAIKKQRQINSL